MLKILFIRNFTLIDELSTSFYDGFSVITGETGAGKSIILGALGMLLGNRADTKLIKQGEQKCVIEAHFDLSRYPLNDFFDENDIEFDSEDTILRRELNINGKSRAFINDTPVSLITLKELGDMLVDIHSQHQNLLLNQENFQLNVIDTIAQNQKEREAFTTVFDTYIQKKAALNDLKSTLEKNKENEEFMRFQLNELAEANLQEDEQEELEEQSQTMSHAEEIKQLLYNIDSLLHNEQNGMIEQLRNVANTTEELQHLYPSFNELSERTNSAYIELKDIADEISSKCDSFDFDPRQLELINSRLDLIYRLEKKHHVDSIGELLNIQRKLEKDVSQLDNSEEDLAELQREVDELYTKAEELGKTLSKTREKSAKVIEKEVLSKLTLLGIPNARFSIEIAPKAIGKDGLDKVNFMFSANKGTALNPISQVASGGEIARLMLALKAMISGQVKLPTIIFDEIDTGVSGRIAEQMANIMEEMGNNNRQVISITHLPQIAAKGKHHYKVTKSETSDGTKSELTQLSDEQRITEIAQMLSGSNITEAAISNAKELLNS